MKTFDAVVIGGGLAGMMAALELRPLRVALVSYRTLGESTSSAWAQGGIAAAVGDDDSPARHAADTVLAGAGLVEQRVAARLAADAPHAIERIAALGVRFDRQDPTHYALGREGAHSRRRILRAGGDATGAELVRAVVAAVRASSGIVPLEGARATRLATHDGAVAGVVVAHGGIVEMLATRAVVLATGGLGGLYRFTTNPRSSRGAGIALAARAGARLADLEFVQFHPTALDVPSDPLPLVTEALRGEGARLIARDGRRLLQDVHPLADLAPRDVVARRVFEATARGEGVFLDARASTGTSFPLRFPTVFAACTRFGIDPRTTPIPVVAAAHYHMGGVAVDLEGRTNVGGLYACGEVAATGVHGANRLASNSLLESVVYPERIARAVRLAGTGRTPADAGVTEADARDARRDATASDEQWAALRALMYANVGVERDEAGLTVAADRLIALGEESTDPQLRDAAFVGALVARAALRRRETRGSHVRTDYPATQREQGERAFSTLADLPVTARTA